LESDTYSVLPDFDPAKILKTSNLEVKYSKHKTYGSKKPVKWFGCQRADAA
jgi:hypothetical protein